MTDQPPAQFHSMRLFPKRMGPLAYAQSGIAARCDWVLHSDVYAPHTHLHCSNPTDAPLHIFLSMRNPYAAIVEFTTRVLPGLHKPFVLVSGSGDCTLPVQIDKRWRPFSATERKMIASILNHPLLIRWFAENLDDASDPRFSPLPTGMVYPKGQPKKTPQVTPLPLHNRPLQVLCGHRIRPGSQWELRGIVTERARTDWASFCTIPKAELPEAEFFGLMQSHAFVICVEGGGLDPSPKAWQAIQHGAIPIIRKTGMHQAYSQLPVAFVDNWEPESLTAERLLAWHKRLSPFHDIPELRVQTLNRLGLDYWWEQIASLARN